MHAVVDVVKASFNLPRTELDQLKELARRRTISVTQALRQAIVSELYLQEIVDRGAKLLVQERDGSIQEIVFAQTRSVGEPTSGGQSAKPTRGTPVPA